MARVALGIRRTPVATPRGHASLGGARGATVARPSEAVAGPDAPAPAGVHRTHSHRCNTRAPARREPHRFAYPADENAVYLFRWSIGIGDRRSFRLHTYRRRIEAINHQEGELWLLPRKLQRRSLPRG